MIRETRRIYYTPQLLASVIFEAIGRNHLLEGDIETVRNLAERLERYSRENVLAQFTIGTEGANQVIALLGEKVVRAETILKTVSSLEYRYHDSRDSRDAILRMRENLTGVLGQDYSTRQTLETISLLMEMVLSQITC